MSLWHPITYNALAKLIASEEKAMETQLLDFWLKIKIGPEKWQEATYVGGSMALIRQALSAVLSI